MSFALAALSGLLLVLIHPDANLYWLAPAALTPLYLAIQREASWKRRFALGWLNGLLYWGGMCYWIQGTLARHGGLNEAAATGVFVLFALAKGLHSAVFATVRPSHPLVFALLWTGLERTHAPCGFPWLTLGDAGIDSALAHLAPYTGVYGLSFVFAWTAAMLPSHWKYVAPLWCVFLLPPAPVEAGRRMAVSAQPNFDEEAPPRDPAALLLKLSAPSKPADLILWPEMPVGLYYEQDTLLRARVSELARNVNAPMIIGAVSFASLHEPRNSAIFIRETGEPAARYDKMNLVPFGEFVPWPFNTFIDKVSTEAGVFTAGTRLVAPQINGHRVGAFVCYESAFPHHVRAFTAMGAEVLVNLTNDGYFARSAARGQHLALARMRAMENRRWLLRSTNDGYTAAVDPHGRVRVAAAPYEPRSVALPFEYASGMPLYARWGDWFAWSCLISAIASTVWARYRPRAVRG